jgi:hypothetical protein
MFSKFVASLVVLFGAVSCASAVHPGGASVRSVSRTTTVTRTVARGNVGGARGGADVAVGGRGSFVNVGVGGFNSFGFSPFGFNSFGFGFNRFSSFGVVPVVSQPVLVAPAVSAGCGSTVLVGQPTFAIVNGVFVRVR